MKIIKDIFIVLFMCCLILGDAASIRVEAKDYSKKKYNETRWKDIQQDYLNTKTDRLIFVKYKGGSKATVEMWKKVSKKVKAPEGSAATQETAETAEDTGCQLENQWKKIISCKAYIGRNGLNKKKQGDRKTPMGIYNITMAFGRKKSPGTAGISYTKLKKYHYWSAEKTTYNKFIDIRKLGRKRMSGEHLINYNPEYNYALAIDYNRKCIYLKGSAIFLHCMGKKAYTMGCVAVSEKNMKTIVKNTTKRTKICIYKK